MKKKSTSLGTYFPPHVTVADCPYSSSRYYQSWSSCKEVKLLLKEGFNHVDTTAK